MKNLSSFILTVIILLLAASEIPASCVRIVQHPPCVEYWRADAVFIATAIKVETQPSAFMGITPPSIVEFAVEEIFKGIEGKQLTLEQDSCGHQFKEGEKYLIYAHRKSSSGKLFVRLGATRTKPISESTDDLEFIRSLQRGEPQPQIVGKVGEQTSEIKQSQKNVSSFDERFFFGSPVANIKVFARRAEQIYETFSNEKGEYKFVGLPSGEYEVWADYPPYFEKRIETVKIVSKGCGIGNLVAHRKGSIGGRVTDASGAPAKHVRLSLVFADASPQEIFEERENDGVWYLAATDKNGEYRFAYLPAGRYYIIINRTEFERSREDRYQKIPRLFYPNTKNIEEAEIISIEEGENIKGKDFRLPKND